MYCVSINSDLSVEAERGQVTAAVTQSFGKLIVIEYAVNGLDFLRGKIARRNIALSWETHAVQLVVDVHAAFTSLVGLNEKLVIENLQNITR